MRFGRYFRDGDVFYGVGANVGAYTLVAARRFDARVKICAFEPSAITLSQPVRNLNLNGCMGTVTPLPVALAHSTHVDVFSYRSLVPGAALHEPGASAGGSTSGEMQMPWANQPLIDTIVGDGFAWPNAIRSRPAAPTCCLRETTAEEARR